MKPQVGQKYIRIGKGCCREAILKEICKDYVLLKIIECTENYTSTIDIDLKEFDIAWQLVNKSKLIKII